jgi:hypothetical protein
VKPAPRLALVSALLLAVAAFDPAVTIGGSRAAKPEAASTATAARTEPAPFARVYLALRGCTSCSHCRSTIRQMVRGNAKGGETRLEAGKVEVRYTSPRPVPLREVVRSLADNRLHDLSLVDVLFEAKGTVVTEKDGTTRFKLADTGQLFPLTVAPSMARPADGRPVRLVALVEGWRAPARHHAELSLQAREMNPSGAS